MTHLFSRILRIGCMLALFAASMVAGAQERSVAEQRMVGAWYGEFAPGTDAPVQRFITVRRVDGTFSLHARMYKGGKVVAEVRNAGLWGISNGMYFTVTTEVDGKRSDPKNPEAINAYLVKDLAAERFDYVHVATGRQFTVTRVDPATARLPD